MATVDSIVEHLPAGRWVRSVHTDGGHGIWLAACYESMREALGWWVRKRESQQTHAARAIDTQRIGSKWTARMPTRWDTVWERTGAQARDTEENEGASSQRGDDGKSAMEIAEEVALQHEDSGGRPH